MGLPAPPALALHDDRRPVSLFLDFDGTLVDLAERPDEVKVSPELAELLERLGVRFDGRIAIVSGRSIAQLQGFFGPLSERLAMVGSHGAEVRAPGSQAVAPEVPLAFRDAEQSFADAFKEKEGVLIEAKTLGVAIHYRLDPSAESEAQRLAEAFASKHGLELQKGKMMVEVRTAGHDKGSGIGALMAEPPFDSSVPVFLGDDVTDEAGFGRCAEMGGFGILVGTPRPTAARYWLPDVPAVHEWLAAL